MIATIMLEEFKPSKDLKKFGVTATDPGFIYLIQDGSRLKIGKSTNPKGRFRSARTWLPHMKVIGTKPFWNHSVLEKNLHIGLAMFSTNGEWYDFKNDEFEEYFVQSFTDFDDKEINRNSIDFIYFLNSSGMAEFTIEFCQRNISKKKFLEEESLHSRPDPENIYD